jgi:hypothetical protein
MTILYLNCLGTRFEFQNKSLNGNWTVWTYKGKKFNDYALENRYEMPGWTGLHCRVFCDCSIEEDSANIMLYLPSFLIELIKVFAQVEWQNRSVQTAIEENCNGSNNKYVNEYIFSSKR